MSLLCIHNCIPCVSYLLWMARLALSTNTSTISDHFSHLVWAPVDFKVIWSYSVSHFFSCCSVLVYWPSWFFLAWLGLNSSVVLKGVVWNPWKNGISKLNFDSRRTYPLSLDLARLNVKCLFIFCPTLLYGITPYCEIVFITSLGSMVLWRA